MDIESNPFQPRRDFDEAEIDALAESLLQHGLLQPVLVRRIDERYQLVAGERRLRAAIKAGWNEVPVQVVEADDRRTAEIAIVENLQRKDLNPLEKAASFQRYLETYGTKQEELAQRLHIDRSTIANLIRLLELPQEVQQAVRAGTISQGHARALLPLGDEGEQLAVCRRVVEEGLSVRAVETIVQEAILSADAEPLASPAAGEAAAPARTRKGQQASLEQELRSALGTKVDIRQGTKGRGKIVIHFTSHEEYERLHAYLCAEAVGPSRQAG
jgi:ParB family chromosome partitioning protein